MERRVFTREFKVEAVRLLGERGVSVAPASRDLDVHDQMISPWSARSSHPVLDCALVGGRPSSPIMTHAACVRGQWQEDRRAADAPTRRG